jgi:uncharacterized membrane protein
MPIHRSPLYWLLLSLTSLWLGMILVAPLLLSEGSVLGLLLHHFFSPLCHQISERSYVVSGFPLAVCARCTGIYLGFWLGLVFLVLTPTWFQRLADTPRLLILFAVPMGLDLMWSNNHLTRTVSGTLAAFPVAYFVWLAVEQFPLRRRLYESRKA